MTNNRFLISLLVTLFFISCKHNTELKIVEANSSSAVITINENEKPGNWTIMPDVNPDIYPVEMEKGTKVKATFKTDIDSISFQLKWGESKDFIVLLNGRDSAFTRFEPVLSKVSFNDDYIQKNKGKWSVEVIEVQELLQVIFAITSAGLADTRSMIINHDTTKYYLSVIDKFLKFKDEPIVGILDSMLQENWYINLKADACALTFSENGQILKSSVYDRMRGARNLLDPYMSALSDFAEKSNFRTFYNDSKPFYDSLIQWQERAIPTKKQWDWLEKQFPDHKYDHYRITFSPLVKGNHSTVRFNNNGFKQVVMFIRPPYRVSSVNKEVSNGLITRFVFTEIDHNYVNPETDKYIDEVNTGFSDLDKWTKGKESKNYRTPYSVFNEYMTWSVYLLYCYDQYNSIDFNIINDRIVKYIINRRGFNRFDDFHGKLLKLYIEKDSQHTIADLYPSLLKWAINYKPEN